MKLTKPQQKVLEKMQAQTGKGWWTALERECSIADLEAMKRIGVIIVRKGRWSLSFWPRTTNQYQLHPDHTGIPF